MTDSSFHPTFPAGGGRFPDAGTQKVLQATYAANPGLYASRPISERGFSVYSQTDEDGILLYLFALLGTTNRRCVEICAGDGIECNTANLILNHGFTGLLVDGNPELVQRSRDFYATAVQTRIFPPQSVQAWITRESVNDLVTSHGFEGEIDLLSLDMDGVDLWIWEALTAIQPRVVVVEFQDILGPDRSWTVPYADDFNAAEHSTSDGMPNFAGASIAAFTKLARREGYRLVGTNTMGWNAFFVRDDIAEGLIAEVSTADCLVHPKNAEGIRDRFPLVENHPWVEF